MAPIQPAASHFRLDLQRAFRAAEHAASHFLSLARSGQTRAAALRHAAGQLYTSSGVLSSLAAMADRGETVPLHGARKHATREIVALAGEWYRGLVSTAFEHFRDDLASGKYHRFTEEGADAELQFEETKAGRKLDFSERDRVSRECAARHIEFERALEKHFLRDDVTAHLVLIASTQETESDAAEALALDVFDLAEKSTTHYAEGRAA